MSWLFICHSYKRLRLTQSVLLYLSIIFIIQISLEADNALEHHDLILRVPEQRYTGTEIMDPVGSSLDLYLISSKPGFQIVESHIVAQSDEDDLVMWWRKSKTHYKIDYKTYKYGDNHPPVQNSREWLEVKGTLAPIVNGSGGGGGVIPGLSFTGDVVSADLDVANFDGKVVPEEFEESKGGFFPSGENKPAILTLRRLQYANAIDGMRSVTLDKIAGGPAVNVYRTYNNGVLSDPVALPQTYAQLELEPPKIFYVTSANPSANPRDIVFEAKSFLLDTGQYATDRVKITAFKIQLKEVSFKEGGGNHVVNDNSDDFSAPHYIDGNLDGDANDIGDRSYPICYSRKTSLVVCNTKFKVSPANISDTIKVKADGPGNVDIDPTDAQIENDIITLTEASSKNVFPDKIDLLDPMTLNWQVTFDPDTASWYFAGNSTNILYVIWGVTPQTTLYQTLVHRGCEAAIGTTGNVGINDNLVLDKIWIKLKSKSLRDIGSNYLLTYYGYQDNNHNNHWDPSSDGNYNTPELCEGLTETHGLLIAKNGQCHAWKSLFVDMLKAQGLPNINGNGYKTIMIESKEFNGALAINNWECEGNQPYVIINNDSGVDGGDFVYPDPSHDEAADKSGTSGQGTSPNPPSIFNNHFIVKISDKYYDPSYGIGPYTDLKDYENVAFFGTVIYKFFPWSDDVISEPEPNDNDPLDHSDEIGEYNELLF